MHIKQSPLQVITRAAALMAFAGAATLSLQAQQAAGTQGSPEIAFVQPSISTSLLALNSMPSAPDTTDTVGYSSSAGEPEAAAAVNYLSAPGVHAMQPPPRRYGRRPVYADSAHNADGSSKYTFFAGAGFTLPTGGTHAYLAPNYAFQVGGGRQFNKTFAAIVEFDWANFGYSDSAKTYLTNEYANLCSTNCTGSAITEVGGHTHDWSFSVGPQYYVTQGEKAGVYVAGGVGFYHKVANITTPGVGEYCDPFYGCITYQADETIDKYTSNSVGVNGGVGFTYKPSRFGNERFYAEARYVYTDNQPKPFYDGVNPPTTNPTSNPNYFNAFPQNSAKTTFIPVTFGIRF